MDLIICSFDIEASSSHGDFPLPKKIYKKPANQIIDKLQKFDGTDEEVTELFKTMVRNGFGYIDEDLIDIVYTKKKISEQTIDKKIETMLGLQVEDIEHGTDDDTLEKWFKSVSIDGEGDGDGDGNGTWCGMAGGASGASGGGSGGRRNMNQLHRGSLLHFLRSGAVKDDKVAKLSDAMNNLFPLVEGDKVTFIGSTFTRYGEDTSYLNHCIALDTCSKFPNSEIESYKTEREVLLAWTKQFKQNPD